MTATVGGSGVYLSWSANATPGTTASYQIAYQTGDTAPSNCTSGTVIAANTMYVNAPNDEVVGLTGGQDYSFRVCAANSDSSVFSTGVTTTVTVPSTISTESSPTVFVSVNTYTGNLGGVYFGDFACQLEAHNASWEGRGKSDTFHEFTANANSRIVLNKAYYNLRPAGSGGPALNTQLTTTNTLWQGTCQCRFV